VKFRLSKDFLVDTDEPPWKTEGLRIGLWGGSGCGKSSTAALFAEQFLTQGGTIVVFEPRAEYQTLKEKFDLVVCGGPYGKDLDFIPSSPASYAKAVVEDGVSIIFYTSDVEDETKLIEFVSKFLSYLLKYNEVTKRPIMLIVEETEEYAPMSTKGRVSPPWVFSRMIRQFKTVTRDARKLNIVPISLSPRPQEINFTIRQLCNLTFFGKFSPQDADYVDRECLKAYKHSFYSGKDLIDLKTGQFAVITSGRPMPLQTITEPRQTKHGAETPKLEYVAPRTEKTREAVTSLTETIQKAQEKERLEESELEKLRRIKDELEVKVNNITKRCETLEQQAATLGKIKIETPTPKTEDVTFIDKVRTDAILDVKEKVTAVLDSLLPQSQTRPVATRPSETDIYKVWEPKLPSKAAKRILKFLLVNKGARYTKAQIAVALGYKSKSGTFNGAISFLRQNNLIKRNGEFYLVEE